MTRSSLFGRIIVVEGPDRVGKLTQTTLLKEALSKQGSRACRVEVPVNDRIFYPIIYWMLKTGSVKRFPNLFQVMHFFNKLLFQAIVLPFLLLRNDYVILDRWSLSAMIYGSIAGVNASLSRIMFFSLIKPDVTIVLNGQRLTTEIEDVYEGDVELQRAVRKGYREWALSHQDDHRLISNVGTKDEVHKRVIEAVYAKCA